MGLGVAGGLVPSPTALLVLLGAIGLGRTWFGVGLVLSYGLGMAGTLTAAGLLLVGLRDRLDRVTFSDRLRRRSARLVAATPALTALLVLVVGLGLAARSLTGDLTRRTRSSRSGGPVVRSVPCPLGALVPFGGALHHGDAGRRADRLVSARRGRSALVSPADGAGGRRVAPAERQPDGRARSSREVRVLALVVAHLALAALLPLVSARSRRGAFALAAVPPAAALLWALAHAPEALAGGVSSTVVWAPELGPRR